MNTRIVLALSALSAAMALPIVDPLTPLTLGPTLDLAAPPGADAVADPHAAASNTSDSVKFFNSPPVADPIPRINNSAVTNLLDKQTVAILFDKFVQVLHWPVLYSRMRMGQCYTGRGSKYNGEVAVTNSGQTCLAWHESGTDTFYKAVGRHNFCRNPDNMAAPWCYTDYTAGSNAFGYCSNTIPQC